MPSSALPAQEQKHVLANGVRVLIEELPHVHSAAVGVWVDTGSIQEDESVSGVCHFIEHMLFKGTQSRTALEIARSVEDAGGSLNAFTDREHTCFYARVLASEVPTALDVLTDMLLESRFDPDEIRREKQVVVEEIKMYEDDPEELVSDLLMENLWAGHPLASPITGTKKSVRGLNRESILGYMGRYYTPDRLVISVAGNVKATAVLRQLEERLGSLSPNGTAPPAQALPYRPGALVKYRDIEQVHLCMGYPGIAVTDERRYALAALNSILGGGMSSRLFQEVREKRGLVYTIGSYETLYRPGGLFAVSAGMSPKHLETVHGLVLEELAKARSGDFAQSELDRAKQQLKGSLLLSLESPRNRMSRLAQSELYFGRIIPVEEVLAAIERVTLADMQQLACELLTPQALLTTVVGPLRRVPKGIQV